MRVPDHEFGHDPHRVDNAVDSVPVTAKDVGKARVIRHVALYECDIFGYRFEVVRGLGDRIDQDDRIAPLGHEMSDPRTDVTVSAGDQCGHSRHSLFRCDDGVSNHADAFDLDLHDLPRP